jgi:hypothetical protein
VAVLCAGAAARPQTRPGPNGHVVSGARGCLAHLAGGDAGGMAVQPRLPAQQGTVFRPRRCQCDRGSRGAGCAAALRGGTGRRARGVPVTRWVRQAAAATALDGVPCRAALVVSTARWTARGPGARFGTADYQVVGRTSAVSAASLARGRLVLHLPGARARAASPRHSARDAGARRRPVVHSTLDTRSRDSAGFRGVVAPCTGGVACAALRAGHGACLHQRRTNVQNCGTRPSRRALDS